MSAQGNQTAHLQPLNGFSNIMSTDEHSSRDRNMRIKAIILCGGQGTRIRDVADDIPKPMIRIGEQPILWHIMKLYAHYNVRDFVLCLGYKGWVIKEFFLNYRAMMNDMTITLGTDTHLEYHDAHPAMDWRVTLAETGYANQTGSRIRQVKKYVEDTDIFCVTYGDGVADIDIGQLIEFHCKHGRIGTVTAVRPPGRFGVLAVREDQGLPVVSQFTEKPQSLEGLINGGFFVFDHRLWDYLSDDDNLIFEHQPLSNLAQDGQLVMYEHSGFWQPMDTYREWRILNDMWASGQTPWKR